MPDYTDGAWVTGCTVCRWAWSDIDKYTAEHERTNHEHNRAHLTTSPVWEPA